MGKPHFRTVFMSDLHLGTPDARAQDAAAFLGSWTAGRLVLAGDVVDGWALRRRSYWAREHTMFFKTLLDKVEREELEVVYVRGNHDDFLEHFMPARLGALRVVTEHLHETANGRYLVVHGDGFDAEITKGFVPAVAGSVAYELLLRGSRLMAFRQGRAVPFEGGVSNRD